MKYRDVLAGIENCALAWVVEGVTFRDLTEEEAIAARNKQAQMREPLEYAELPGIVFRKGDDRSYANAEMVLAYEAQQFFEEARA